VAALLNALGMNLCTIAYQAEKSSFVSLMCYSSVVFGFLMDSFGFGVGFTWMQILGASIVLCFNIFVIVSKMMEGK
jgi:drug/metabolite transporter (DMT)-like permease